MHFKYDLVMIFVIFTLQTCTSHKEYSKRSNDSIKQDSVIKVNISNSNDLDSASFPKWFMSLEEALKTPLKVEYLILRGKNYKEFPEEILLFQNLKQLDISLNPLRKLSPKIDQLEKLEELHVAYCELVNLPQNISGFKNLKRLDLLDNNLTTLPNSIGELHNLETLNLTENPIISIPDEISNLKKLKRFGILGENGDPNPNFTPEKRKHLQSLLPNCKITFD